MFFRREKTTPLSFAGQIEKLRSAGFGCENVAGGAVRVSRNGLAALVSEGAGGTAVIGESGLLLGGELGLLTDLGYQKVFRTDHGKQAAAQAEHLVALHAFVEDLREALGLTSLYNEGLGTTNERHLYDRVVDRDKPHQPRVWER